MIIAHKFKLKPNNSQKAKMVNWLDMLRCHYNFCLRDRIDCSWGELKLKIQSVADKFGCIVLEVDPKYTSQECSHCGHIDANNRNKEKFVCTNCGFIADADNQASIVIGKKGIEILNLSISKLRVVRPKVTAKSELTGSRNRNKSVSLEIESSNPLQLNLFEWRNGQVTDYSESPVTASA